MKKTATAILMACIAFGANAEDFFSTKECDNLFETGVRVGINTSNRTIGKNALPGYNREGWGTGFELGVVTDINIRNYLSIQPGIFFESRSNSYTMVSSHEILDLPGEYTTLTQAGNLNTCYLTIPIMGCVHFNVTDDLRWNVEMGPYIAIRIGNKLKNEVCLFSPDPSNGDPVLNGYYSDYVFAQKAKGCDFGIKMGTGLTLKNKYSFSVHYMGSCTHAWNDLKFENLRYTYGAHSKEWTFTLGYTF